MKGVLVLMLLVLCSCSAQEPQYPVVKADGSIVKIPRKDVSDGRVHFFSFKSGGKNINFFVRMDGAGKLHTCFDACFTCYKFKKGYRVEGTNIACNPAPWHPPALAKGGKRFLATVKNEASRVSSSGRSRC